MKTDVPALGGCKRDTCFAPETACVLGRNPCDNLSISPETESGQVASGPALPWSGLALGLSDVSAVAATARQRLVALVGLPGAGKTTALAAHWIAARRGGGRYGPSFAGSYTLLGWHHIARHLQWVPFGSGGFPPHTSATNSRVPALLHVSLDIEDGPVHVLHTDVPGEWFRSWAYEEAASPGARWIADHADAFVVASDSMALASEERGTARGDYEALAERLASVVRDRPVVCIRTKADVDVPQSIREHIDALNQRLFDAPTTLVSVHERAKAPLTEALDAGIAAALASKYLAVATEEPPRDTMLVFRSTAAEAPA